LPGVAAIPRTVILSEAKDLLFMRITALDHIQLAMPTGGETKARAFYAGVLDIPEVPKPANLAVRGGCWFERGPLKIHLGAESDFRPAKKAHPALLVEDLAALQKSLEVHGYIVSAGDELKNYRRIYTEDPFGNRIELMERV
jgi:catechol 2,3-dioxygenase-like lactoylglutathione lyase family enzyme